MNSTLVMVAVLAAVAMLPAALVVVPIQQANAQDSEYEFDQDQSNKCSGHAYCSNSATITFIP